MLFPPPPHRLCNFVVYCGPDFELSPAIVLRHSSAPSNRKCSSRREIDVVESFFFEGGGGGEEDARNPDRLPLDGL